MSSGNNGDSPIVVDEDSKQSGNNQVEGGNLDTDGGQQQPNLDHGTPCS